MLLVIAGVVFGTVAVQNSWWAEDAPEASADQKASDGSTMLTDAGFDYANVEGIVRVRIGDSGLSARELGLPEDGEKTAEFRRPVRAVIAGRDDVYVVDDIATLTARSEDDRLASVTLRFDVVSTWSDGVDLLRRHAEKLGWDPAQLDGLDEQLAEFNRDGEGDSFTATITSDDGGATVTGVLVFDRASGITPVFVEFTPAP
nr:hypothetical protein [Microbacterium immunditiarum]